jgi:hypothetical protein
MKQERKKTFYYCSFLILKFIVIFIFSNNMFLQKLKGFLKINTDETSLSLGQHFSSIETMFIQNLMFIMHIHKGYSGSSETKVKISRFLVY